MSVTIRDIARQAGIHYATVSRALSGCPGVRESTRKKVLRTAERMGYVINRNAQSLSSGRTKLVSLMVSNLNFEQVSDMANAIQQTLLEKDYALLLLLFNNQQELYRKWLCAFSQKLCDAAIIGSAPQNFQELQEFDLLEKQHFPILYLDQWFPKRQGTVVTNDAEKSAELLTERLLANGMEAAFLSFSQDDNTVSNARENAVCRILKEKKIPFVTEPDKLYAMLRKTRIQNLGVYGNAPLSTPDPRTLNLPYVPIHRMAAMFDPWQRKDFPFYDQVFLCIQDDYEEGRLAAQKILEELGNGPPAFNRKILTVPPLKILSLP